MKSRKKRGGSFIPVGEVAGKFLMGESFKENQEIFRIFKAWQEIVGKKASLHSCPDRVSAECLYISVDNPVWSSELGFKKKEILVRLAGMEERAFHQGPPFHFKSVQIFKL